MANIDIPEFSMPFVFRDQPTAIKGDLRPLWRMCLVVLLMRKCCRGNRTSHAKLHVLNWAMLNETNRTNLLKLTSGESKPTDILVRIEPFLNVAVNYALGEGLIEQKNGDRLVLSTRGVTLADKLIGMEDVFESEKQFIALLGNKLSEKLVTELFA